ncbi:MAG: hypothetical protein HOO91_19090 [Bacteroidales bacterium]|nr:hypothetical protein [Bacteroidales bacterium]
MKKNLVYALLLVAIGFASCKKENENESQGTIQFGLSKSQQKLKFESKAVNETPSTILISITDSKGKVILESKEIVLFNMNGSYLSEPLPLIAGNYSISKFIVLNSSDSAIFATPLKNSKFAYLVNNPLPIEFSISKDNITKIVPEVISVEGASFEDFGYDSFSFDVVKTFNFLTTVMVYNESVKNWELTSANISIKNANNTVAYSGVLAAITNQITLRDNSTSFSIAVSKDGYQTYYTNISANELKLFYRSEDKGPLIIRLLSESTTVTDIDGNVYHTVKIGSQVWMVENLRVTKYNDGSSIPNVTDNSWLSLTTGAYCWYNNDQTFMNPYGAMYNWYAVNTGKLAPIGWHVPTLAEWNTLSSYVGGACGALKEIGLTHWFSPNGDATNGTGFTAVPSGSRVNVFVNMGYFSQWWSATQLNSTSSYEWTLRYNDGAHFYSDNGKAVGDAVRCIKD